MRKIEEEEMQKDFLSVSRHESPILNDKLQPIPKVEPSVTKPLHADRILNPEALPFEPPNAWL